MHAYWWLCQFRAYNPRTTRSNLYLPPSYPPRSHALSPPHPFPHPSSHGQSLQLRIISFRTLCGQRHRSCTAMVMRSSVWPAVQMEDTSHLLARYTFHSILEWHTTHVIPFCLTNSHSVPPPPPSHSVPQIPRHLSQSMPPYEYGAPILGVSWPSSPITPSPSLNWHSLTQGHTS